MDLTFGIGDALGAITSIFNQKAQSDHERKLNERTIQAQKDAAEYAYERDLEMWQRSNEYNAPTMQMSRLRDAGLNPNLVYGKGATATSSANLPKYNAVRPEYKYSQPFAPSGILAMYNDFRKANAEVDLLQKQGKKAEAEAEFAYDYNRGRAWQSLLKGDLYQFEKGKMYGNNRIQDWQGKWFNMSDTPGKRKFDADIQNAEKRNQLLDQQIKYYLWNNLGSATLKLLRDGFDKVKSQKSPIYNKNNKISKMFNTGDKLKWKKNKVFQDYTSSEFSNYIGY